LSVKLVGCTAPGATIRNPGGARSVRLWLGANTARDVG